MDTVLVRRSDPGRSAATAWRIGMCRAKLQTRGRLPGAFGFDLATATYRAALQAGIAAADLVPLALPGSWMVNNKVPSPVFQRWLQPGLRATWTRLCALLQGDWPSRTPDERAEVEACVRALAEHDAAARGGAPGAPTPGTAAGLSKVLALLCPDTVPLMDDAALWFALGVVPRPSTADAPSAGPEHFVPMLDWFASAVLEARPVLRALADEYTLAALSPAQTLDRLLWFETWGHRVVRAPMPWWWISEGPRAAIVPLPVGPAGASPGTPIALEAVEDVAWRDAARQALDVVWAGES